jgi:hypothetical protein
MNLLLDDLTINISNINQSELVENWLWLIPGFNQILLISKMGDMFLSANNGNIYWLATDDGSLTKIANSKAEFEEMLTDEANIDNWFLPLLISELAAANKYLVKNEVYSFKKLPIIGGDYSVENLDPTDVNVHFTLTGVLYQQIKDLPDRTKVQIKLID